MKKLNSLRLFRNSQYSANRNVSALYITGDKASNNFAVLVPYIDFEDRIKQKSRLAENISARKLSIDLDKVEKHWQFFKSLEIRRKKLVDTKTEIGVAISNLIKTSSGYNEEIEKLKLHSTVVKDELRHLKNSYYEVEEETMKKILNLPNILHERTPIDEENICHTYSEKINSISPSHLILGKNAGLIEYLDHFTCFLKSTAAIFEQCSMNYARKFLQDCNFIHFSNSNLCRSLVAEGCGEDIDKNSELLTIAEITTSAGQLNNLHLRGSGTLESFMAYFSRHTVQHSLFPLTYFSLGRTYKKINNYSYNSLFNLGQESTVCFFAATLETDCTMLDIIIAKITQFYNSLGYHYRLVILPAKQLKNAECFRLSVQMYSNFLEKYVEVGNISSYNDFVSKRLLFAYSDNKERKYPMIISGTWLNVPHLLGCVLENNSFKNDSLLSDVLKEHMF